MCLNKLLSKQSWGWWFETPLRSLWRYYNVVSYEEVFLRVFPKTDITGFELCCKGILQGLRIVFLSRNRWSHRFGINRIENFNHYISIVSFDIALFMTFSTPPSCDAPSILLQEVLYFESTASSLGMEPLLQFGPVYMTDSRVTMFWVIFLGKIALQLSCSNLIWKYFFTNTNHIWLITFSWWHWLMAVFMSSSKNFVHSELFCVRQIVTHLGICLSGIIWHVNAITCQRGTALINYSDMSGKWHKIVVYYNM